MTMSGELARCNVLCCVTFKRVQMNPVHSRDHVIVLDTNLQLSAS